jgi:hypothetical protein
MTFDSSFLTNTKNDYLLKFHTCVRRFNQSPNVRVFMELINSFGRLMQQKNAKYF